MASSTSSTDVLQFEDGQKPELPSALNVVTILTIIWCVISIGSGIWTYFTVENSYKKMVEAQDKLAEAPAFVRKMMGPEMLELTRKSMENKLPVMLLTLLGSALCLWGALEMRKLKKQGFVLWLAGEFLPVIAAVIIIGFGIFSGFALVGLIFPVVFLVLYGVQRKHLIY